MQQQQQQQSRRGSALKTFYTIVQFIMLGVSIPKVALFFHAYDATTTFGPLLLGIDIPSWAAGIAVDLCAALTSWAALTRFEATRQRRGLLAPAVIIAACTGISLLANYEYALLHTTGEYAAIPWAALINPIVVASPPFLVLLLIALVPSILAQPRIKSAAEIKAETDESEARIAAEAQLKAARARANVQVRSAQLGGMVDTARAVGRAWKGSVNRDDDPQPPEGPPDGPGHGLARVAGAEDRDGWGADERGETRRVALLDTAERTAIRNAAVSRTTAAHRRGGPRPQPLHVRVAQSGVVTVNDLTEALWISPTQARTYLKKIVGDARENGRLEAPLAAVLDAFRSSDELGMRAHRAQLEAALAPTVKRGSRVRRTVGDDLARARASGAQLRVLRPQSTAAAGDGESDGIALAGARE